MYFLLVFPSQNHVSSITGQYLTSLAQRQNVEKAGGRGRHFSLLTNNGVLKLAGRIVRQPRLTVMTDRQQREDVEVTLSVRNTQTYRIKISKVSQPAVKIVVNVINQSFL